jgi:S1-C subfamily serine protease
MKKVAAVAAVSLAGGVGIGIGQGLVSGGGGQFGPNVPGLSAVWARQSPQMVTLAARSQEEETVVRVARQARPAVVTVVSEDGGGSGVITRGDGVILTNAHVVGSDTEVQVRLADGRPPLTGRVVGRDREVDIAVVKIPGNDLPAAPLGDSDRWRSGKPRSPSATRCRLSAP